MPLTDAIPDHIAIAVPRIDDAAPRWNDQLGGVWVSPRYEPDGAGFATRQVRYRGGGKVELLEPVGEDGFAHRFLTRYGSSIHHLTLKVPELLPAVEQVRAEGFDVVDVSTANDLWHEGFLRPSQVGGLVVQIAWAGFDDDAWRAAADLDPVDPAPDAPQLIGMLLEHPDLDDAARVWTALGAEVSAVEDGDGVDGAPSRDVSWVDAPLELRVRQGPRPGPVALRLQDVGALPPDPTLGAAVVPA